MYNTVSGTNIFKPFTNGWPLVSEVECNIQLPWWITNSVDIGQTSYGGRSTTNKRCEHMGSH